MSISSPSVPTPPRMTGEAKIDNGSLSNWMTQLYNAIVLHTGGPIQRLDRAVAVEDAAVSVNEDTTEISEPPTQEEVAALQESLNTAIAAIEELQDKVNELMGAIRGD